MGLVTFPKRSKGIGPLTNPPRHPWAMTSSKPEDFRYLQNLTLHVYMQNHQNGAQVPVSLAPIIISMMQDCQNVVSVFWVIDRCIQVTDGNYRITTWAQWLFEVVNQGQDPLLHVLASGIQMESRQPQKSHPVDFHIIIFFLVSPLIKALWISDILRIPGSHPILW